MLRNLDNSWKVLTISINLDNLDKNLDADLSQLKSLDFKNLDQELKNFGLDMMDNLDRFQKLILTDWEISILISIGLDCRDPQAYIVLFCLDKILLSVH
jgi:hypothetical protein